jgi:hypothetical protein
MLLSISDMTPLRHFDAAIFSMPHYDAIITIITLMPYYILGLLMPY